MRAADESQDRTLELTGLDETSFTPRRER